MVCMPLEWFLDGIDPRGVTKRDNRGLVGDLEQKRKGTPTFEEAFEERRMDLENKRLFQGWDEKRCKEEYYRLKELYGKGGSERL